MDKQIEYAKDDSSIGAKPTPYSSGHLMCRTSWWGVAGFLGCAYFAWLSFDHIAHDNYEWPHDWWTVATYVVWMILLGVLALDTSCLRERLFFGTLLTNFVIGCALILWYSVSPSEVRTARIVTGGLWAVAALLSLTTIGKEAEARRKDARRR